MRHNRACNVEDFRDPSLRATIRDVFAHELVRFGHAFPTGREYRKHWEVAMACRALRELGVLGPEATALGVAAGTEPTLFWLTRHAGRVVATDLYRGALDWWAPASMLHDPGRHWPGPWDPARLRVEHMDALDLRLDDETVDAIFSSSSIEHVGDRAAVGRALDEMLRVLRPGGVLSISTELRLAGDEDMPGTILFRPEELVDVFVGGRAWSPSSPPDLRVSDATLANPIAFEQTLADLAAHHARCGEIRQHELVWSSYPTLVVRAGHRMWTSVHLALRKHGEGPDACPTPEGPAPN